MSDRKIKLYTNAVMCFLLSLWWAFSAWWWFTGHEAFAYKWSSSTWRIVSAWIAAIVVPVFVGVGIYSILKARKITE